MAWGFGSIGDVIDAWYNEVSRGWDVNRVDMLLLLHLH
jgi:hypothetical protein